MILTPQQEIIRDECRQMLTAAQESLRTNAPIYETLRYIIIANARAQELEVIFRHAPKAQEREP